MPTDLRDTVTAEVRAEMARRRMSQTALAELIGEQQWWISKRLTRATPFTLEDLDRIAQALGLPPTFFMQQRAS
jgi:transcriptional regulator with XRE-family HTH domain